MRSAAPSMRTSSDTHRLKVKPDAPVTGFVDGAWWPASRDLAAELPALASELATWGAVESVSYNLDAWDKAPRKVRVDGRLVRLDGFRSQDHDTVDVIGARRRLTLLIVPPETEPRAAEDALATASRDGNTDGVDALLAGARR